MPWIVVALLADPYTGNLGQGCNGKSGCSSDPADPTAATAANPPGNPDPDHVPPEQVDDATRYVCTSAAASYLDITTRTRARAYGDAEAARAVITGACPAWSQARRDCVARADNQRALDACFDADARANLAARIDASQRHPAAR